MNLSDSDINAVRRVLKGEVSIAESAETFSVPQIMLVGVTALLAVDKTHVAKNEHGGYGKLLHEIAVMPGNPKDWSYSERHRKAHQALLNQSRAHGIHTTQDRGGNNLSITPVPDLLALLDEDPSYRQVARGWYQSAVARIEEKERNQREVRRQFLQTPEYGSEHLDFDIPEIAPTDLDELHRVHAQLGELYGKIGEILGRYSPEE